MLRFLVNLCQKDFEVWWKHYRPTDNKVAIRTGSGTSKLSGPEHNYPVTTYPVQFCIKKIVWNWPKPESPVIGYPVKIVPITDWPDKDILPLCVYATIISWNRLYFFSQIILVRYCLVKHLSTLNQGKNGPGSDLLKEVYQHPLPKELPNRVPNFLFPGKIGC